MCRQSYNLHPYVKKGVLTLALNGTLTSSDLVNVTVTVSLLDFSFNLLSLHAVCVMHLRCCISKGR